MAASAPIAGARATVQGVKAPATQNPIVRSRACPGARQEEQIGLLRQLFTEPVVDFSGRFDRIDRAALVPRPAQAIPILLGASSEAAYDRAARVADGFLFLR